MNIVVFGASGYCGKAILAEALVQGHTVTAFTRNRNNLPVPQDRLNGIEGDVLDRESVRQALRGQDAVIQCLGIGGQGNGQPTTFVSEATRLLVEEMESLAIKRLIALSNVGAGDSAAHLPWAFRTLILPYFMRWLYVIIEDKNRMEPLIFNSTLDYTVVRCPNVVDKPPRGKCHATLDGRKLKFTLTLGDMAAFVVNQTGDRTYSRNAVSISN